ncbi:MAG: antibiotic biosynthesis monooxygenase family protein [Nitrososphaeraceae archaeon]
MIESHSQHKWTKTLPVILINEINVNPKDIDQFLKAWTKNAAIMKEQPRFVSTQLYRGIAGSCTFINYAVWESSDHYKQAFGRPSNPSLSTLSDFPTNTVSPHLFKKVAIPGICVD